MDSGNAIRQFQSEPELHDPKDRRISTRNKSPQRAHGWRMYCSTKAKAQSRSILHPTGGGRFRWLYRGTSRVGLLSLSVEQVMQSTSESKHNHSPEYTVGRAFFDRSNASLLRRPCGNLIQSQKLPWRSRLSIQFPDGRTHCDQGSRWSTLVFFLQCCQSRHPRHCRRFRLRKLLLPSPISIMGVLHRV